MTEGTNSKPAAEKAPAALAVLPDPMPTVSIPETKPWTMLEAVDACDAWLRVKITRHVLPSLLTSAIACFIVVGENVFGVRHRQWYLLFNLILAWIPLGWAYVVFRMSQQKSRNHSLYVACCVLWLLFLPNAPYLFTDLVHLFGKSLPYYWSDMMKILLFAMAGMGAGMLSLRLMHSLVENRFGRKLGWVFVAVAAGLCSVGVGLGRFNRWNSWDILKDPKGIIKDAFDFTQSTYVTNPKGLFVVILAILLFCYYITLFAFAEPLKPQVETEANRDTDASP